MAEYDAVALVEYPGVYFSHLKIWGLAALSDWSAPSATILKTFYHQRVIGLPNLRSHPLLYRQSVALIAVLSQQRALTLNHQSVTGLSLLQCDKARALDQVAKDLAKTYESVTFDVRERRDFKGRRKGPPTGGRKKGSK